MKSSIVAATFLVTVLQGLPPLVGPLVPDGTGIVTGLVRHANTGRPITEAQVALMRPGESIERAFANAIATDVNGRFTIKGITPGDHVLVAQAEGFFGISDEITGSERATRDVTVFEGQQVDIGALDLIPGAAISGRIAGPDGRPAIAARVEALRAAYVHGRLTFNLVKSTRADDLGEYRLFWLPPGEYYIRGQYGAPAADRQERYERMFFPGIVEEDAAPPIAVGAGSEISAIDIRVSATPIAGVTVSGRVTGTVPNDAPGPLEWRVIFVHAVPRDRKVILVGDDADVFQNHAADPGQFEIRNVPPGDYNLLLFVRDSGERIRAASVPVSVAAADVENIAAVLEPETELRGRVTWDPSAPEASLTGNSLLLMALDRLPGVPEAAAVAIKPDPETGEFVVPRLPSGRYALRLAPSFRPLDAYIKDVERGGTSVADAGIAIGGESSDPVHVVLNSQGGILSGKVLDSTRLNAFPHARVVIVPDAPRRENPALYKHTVSGRDGGFKFLGVAPGNYKVLAFEAVTAGAWENPLFIAKYEERGLSVSMDPASEKTVQLTIIR